MKSILVVLVSLCSFAHIAYGYTYADEVGFEFHTNSIPEYTDRIAVDIDNDGDVDVLTNEGNRFEIWKQNSNKDFERSYVFYAHFNSVIDFVCGDFNSDGRKDIAVSSSTSTSTSIELGMHIWYQQPDGSFESELFNQIFPHYMTTGDINKDGKSDLVARNYRWVVVYLQEEAGLVVRDVLEIPQPSLFGSIVVTDFDRDGRKDIVLYNADAGKDDLCIYYGERDGTFLPATYFDDPSFDADKRHAFALVDLNMDGVTDIVFANKEKVFAYFSRRSGGYRKRVIVTVKDEFPFEEQITNFTFKRVAGNKRLDLVLTTFYNTYIYLVDEGGRYDVRLSHVLEGGTGIGNNRLTVAPIVKGDKKVDIMTYGDVWFQK